jgi:PAS domain S-box-containing protein
MAERQPLYNSRITKTYVNYLRKYHPDIDVDGVLAASGIQRYQIEDPAHWFTQEEVDRFHEILMRETGDEQISRRVGRYTASSEGMGAGKQYMLGLMSPTALYTLMEKNMPLLSRGVSITAQKIGPNSVEIVSIPKPGVTEKPYQCGNRTGTFESLASLFTKNNAAIDHPECIHRGDPRCRYIVTWEQSPSHIWRRLRNILFVAFGAAALLFFFLLSFSDWLLLLVSATTVIAGLSFIAEYLERKNLIQTVRVQKEAAEESLAESEIRYNNALLIEEIGQATSKILDIDRLVETVISIIEKRLEFDRGMIMLANKNKSRLCYAAGYGYAEGQESLLRETTFHLDKPDSKGVFVRAMKERKPFLVDDIEDIENSLSPKSLEFARQVDSQALICVPIVYEDEALGILAVDNSKSKRPLRQSDMSLLLGLTSQLAVSIINAMSFEKIQESEKKYRELVETANSIILRIDNDGRITFFNEFAQRLFGYNENEILGQSAARIIIPDTNGHLQSFDELVKSLQQDPERPIVSENRTRLQTGEPVWIAWTYKPIFNDRGQFVEILCIGNDITELKRADQERKELQVQLQRAQKMEAIGTLAGGVAHDLNNILSGIVSYPELLLMDLPADSSMRKPIQTIQKSGERAAAIVQDLLTLARRGVETTEVVNLNQIVLEYLQSPEYAKLELNHPNVSLVTELDEQLLNILGSPVHLSKTVMNLVSNAAEAIPDGGIIKISTVNQNVEKIKTGYDDIVSGDYVVLRVADDGIGISPEDLERIFEPFYTKKTMGRSGTGLGMAVVWGTVKDHRGYIDIQSVEGEGSRVTLYFPVTRRAFVKEAELFSLDEIRGRGERILVVDDIQEQREIASEMLLKLGYRVETVSSGEAAIDYLRHHAADLLVLDMIMEPGLDGLETYRRALKLNPDQKIIIASGYSESSRVKQAQKMGAGAYIKKPYLLEKIGRAVRSELDRNAAKSEGANG